MAGSSYGNIFRVSTWGESHGKGVGVVIDGCPAGLFLNENMIQPFMDRRKPGATKYSTPRKESDEIEILSGTFEGRTTGTPISMIVYNKTQRSQDYSEIASYYRPGHADFTFDQKYGFRDYRGGGRSSGRETIARVAGAGTLVPITGFANSIASPAIEFKSEGLILGLGAKMFTVAGPVLVYGISTSIIVGFIYYLVK